MVFRAKHSFPHFSLLNILIPSENLNYNILALVIEEIGELFTRNLCGQSIQYQWYYATNNKIIWAFNFVPSTTQDTGIH